MISVTPWVRSASRVQARTASTWIGFPLNRSAGEHLDGNRRLGVANPAGKQHLARGARTRGWLKRDLLSVRGPSSGCAWRPIVWRVIVRPLDTVGRLLPWPAALQALPLAAVA